jgi:RsiW-degrading membrane proteinase PrsW (M82 family)
MRFPYRSDLRCSGKYQVCIFGYGLSVAPSRALLAIPGHMAFAVFMGYFYGRAKLWHDVGTQGTVESHCLWAAWLSAVFFHGFYDSCAMIGTESFGHCLLCHLCDCHVYHVVFFLIRHESQD